MDQNMLVQYTHLILMFRFQRRFQIYAQYTAELIALLLALNWIKDAKPSNSTIFTDSLSTLVALQDR